MKRWIYGAIIMVVITSSIILIIAAVNWFHRKAINYNYNNDPIEHSEWDALLKKHVDPHGKVDYQGFIEDRAQFDSYIQLLENNHPGKDWTKEEKMAYWINAYNAFTVQLIIDRYPLKSIKEIPKIRIPMVRDAWSKKFIKIQKERYSLGQIEHSILRVEFDDPRIHFAINCASVSCPKLRNEAYTPDLLEFQLHEQTLYFINNANKNIVTPSDVRISKIFQWFKGDFTETMTLREYINQYSITKIPESTEINFIEYDWDLNE